MAKNINLKFLKERFFNGKLYKIGEIEKMTMEEAKAYIEYGSGKIVHISNNDLYDLSYKSLQNMCKEKNINATGKRDDLIKRLKNDK